MKIIKRDGRIVDYDRNKIVLAISKANKEVNDKEKISSKDIDKIITYIESLGKKRMLVEDIQDIIEEKLMERKKYTLAKKYIIYRYTRSIIRKSNTTDASILSLLKNSNYKDVILTAPLERNIMAGETSIDISKRLLLPKNVTTEEEKGHIKVNNLEYFVDALIEDVYIPIDKMLNSDIVIGNNKLNKPTNFREYINNLTLLIMDVSNNITGNMYIEYQDIVNASKIFNINSEDLSKGINDLINNLNIISSSNGTKYKLYIIGSNLEYPKTIDKLNDKRFNQGSITLNSYDNIDDTLNACFEGFLCINHNLQGTYSDKSPILWQRGVIANLKEKERIDDYLKAKYSYMELILKIKDESILPTIKDKVNKWNKETSFEIVIKNNI